MAELGSRRMGQPLCGEWQMELNRNYTIEIYGVMESRVYACKLCLICRNEYTYFGTWQTEQNASIIQKPFIVRMRRHPTALWEHTRTHSPAVFVSLFFCDALSVFQFPSNNSSELLCRISKLRQRPSRSHTHSHSYELIFARPTWSSLGHNVQLE